MDHPMNLRPKGGSYSSVTILVAVLAVLAFVKWGGLGPTAKKTSALPTTSRGASAAVLHLSDLPSGWRQSSATSSSLQVADTAAAGCEGLQLPAASEIVAQVGSPDFVSASSSLAVATDTVAYRTPSSPLQVLNLY